MKRLFLFLGLLACGIPFFAQEVEPVLGWFGAAYENAPKTPYAGDLPAGSFVPYDNGAIPTTEADGVFVIAKDLKLPNRGGTASIVLGPGYYPRDVYVEGILVLRTGSHVDSYASTIYSAEIAEVPPNVAGPGGTIRVVIESFPRGQTNPVGEVFVGTHEEASRYVFWRNLFNVHLIQASVVAALILFLYFLFLFFTQGAREFRFLEFALFCLAFSLAYANMSLFNDGANELVLEKLSRIGLPFTSLILFFFSLRVSGLLAGEKAQRVSWAVRITASALTLLFSALIAIQTEKTGIDQVLSAYGTSILLPLLLVATLVCLIAGVVKKRNVDSVIILAGFVVTISTSVFDIASVNSGFTPYCYLVPYGYLSLVLAIFFVLSLDQATTARNLAIQSRVSEERNQALGEMILELTRVSENLVASSADMERTLAETLDTVEQFGNDNKAITESVARQFREVELEIGGVTETMSLCADKIPRAIENQTAAAEQVTRTLSEMNSHIRDTLTSADVTAQIAGGLAKSANDSARIIGLSREAIGRVSEFSLLLKDVLKTIEDISERTNVLSINAAIESARLGMAGRGFGVVAQEIRNLANQSRESLQSSFDRIRDMTEAVEASNTLSVTVSEALASIIAEAKKSSDETVNLKNLVEAEQEQGAQMVQSAHELLEQARSLRETSTQQTTLNQSLDEHMKGMRESFKEISAQLGAQSARRDDMFSALSRIHSAVEGNAENIDRLKASIGKANRSRGD